MKKNLSIILPAVLLSLLFSCGGNNDNPETESNQGEKKENVKKAYFDTERLTGMYIGDFGKSTLILQINYAQGKNASGFNIVRGNKRNIKGSIEQKGNFYHFMLNEPGNDEFDGKFEFDIDTTDFSLSGKWIPNNPDKASIKEFTLKRTEKRPINEGFKGDWSGHLEEINGTLSIKANSTVTFHGSYYMENHDPEYEIVDLTGSYIQEEDGSITVEFSKHKRLKKSQFHLKITMDEDMGMEMVKDGSVAEFYPYGYW